MKKRAYKNFLFMVLISVLVFKYVERMALALLLKDIKVDLALHDVQLGILSGIGFALCCSMTRVAARCSTLRVLVLLLASCAARAGSGGPGSQIEAPDARCKSLQAQGLFFIPEAPTQVTSAVLIKNQNESPAHCQVRGYVAQNIGFQAVLPIDWNGRFMEVGCAGHCGFFQDDHLPMKCVDALRRNYACIASDMGHKGTGLDGLWGYANLEAKINWGYRATHVVALAGRALAERYYGTQPRGSYFVGCSTGGRQALQEAQRFPWDFDGIVAGAPPVNLSTIYMRFAWAIRAARDQAGNQLLQEADLKLLSDTVIAKCDMDDGVRDGIVSNPFQCAFDPAELSCKSGQSSRCLTPPQVQAVKRIYSGPMTSDGRKLSSGGPLVGSELVSWKAHGAGWRSYLSINGAPPVYEKLAVDGFRFLFFLPDAGSAWNLDDFDFDRDYKRMGLSQSIYDSSNPDLRTFKEAGGKLLIFQGLNDNSVIPRDTVDYFETVQRTVGGAAAAQSFIRLFMLPGVGHCYGGAGADTADYLSAIEAWVERGEAPDRLIAAHVNSPNGKGAFWLGADSSATAFTRPIYPYPARARYKGSGDPDDASSFEMVRP